MKLFNFKKRSEENVISSSDDVLLSSFLTSQVITKDQAMNIAAVAKCVNLISETVAMIPIKLYSEEFIDGKRKTNEIEDPRCDLLNYDTLDTLDGIQFKRAIVRDYLLSGNAYAFNYVKIQKMVTQQYILWTLITIVYWMATHWIYCIQKMRKSIFRKHLKN